MKIRISPLQYDFIVSCIAIIGIFGSFYQAFPLMNPFLFIAMVTLFVVTFFGLRREANKGFILVSSLLYLLLLVLCSKVILDGAYHCYNVMVDVYSQYDSYVFEHYPLDLSDTATTFTSTLTMLAVYFPALLVCLTAILKKKLAFLSCLMSVSIFILTILYKVPVNWLCVMMIGIFWVALYSNYHMRKVHVDASAKQHVSIVIMSICIVLMSTMLCLSPPDNYTRSDMLDTWKQNIIITIKDFIEGNFTSDEIGEVDLANAGNRFYTGDRELIVEDKEEAQWYLKTYSSGVFEDDKWIMLPLEEYERFNVQDAAFSTLDRLYDVKNTRQIKVQDLRIQKKYGVIPYNVSGSISMFVIENDSYVIPFEDKEAYDFTVWDTNRLHESELNYNYDDYYRAFIRRNYTKVPEDIKALFTYMNIGGILANLDDNGKMEWIKNWLQSQASYSLTPGKAPSGKNFVEYFLTENKKGYCVHFATSATLLLQYSGIPARYVEGYRVDSGSRYKDGKVNVLDSDAHAWAEVYDKNRGWVPFEVTPAVSVDTPETDDPATPKPDTPENPEVPKEEPTDNSNKAPDVSQKGDESSFELIYILPFIILAVAIIAIEGQRRLRIRWRKKKMTCVDRAEAVLAIYDYIAKVETYGDSCDKSVYEIVEKARYSQHVIDEAEYMVVYDYVKVFVIDQNKKIKWIKKLKFKYIDCL